ncbi:sulfatase domain protein [Metarhizium robertsii ARSEF 23]|nr:sulfatase domain protein [Metarhizium robertsii ARSEF 23]EFZ04534.2 sulfatase domain protein [Metarhizium robertsii ARSEF 23]
MIQKPGLISLQFSGVLADSWDNITALADPIPLPWLPKDYPLPGFEDWYESDKKHYDAAADPLKISNLDEDVISSLHGRLKDISIRHIVFLVLESTRRDVFPLKKGGFIWNALANSFENKTIPDEAEKMLTSLTTTANYITGDYDDGFGHREHKIRGGLIANNAHTGSGYTLKSVAAVLCGLVPAAIDFNVEFKSHFYQPCLPHILQALSTLTLDTRHNDEDFTSFPWQSKFMQSAVGTFDYQEPLMASMGYTKENVITREYLQSDEAKFGKQKVAATNYFSIPEVALKEYIRDTFRLAENTKERVFLSHLTSTTHHDWGIPKSESYIPLAGSHELESLSYYLNCIRYQDRWLKQILEILEEEGVANETLVVVTGDHGTPVAEGGVATYNNPHTISYQVPLIFSHPDLPRTEINDAVTSVAILPTILDLLIQSDSISTPAGKAAQDLLKNFEGQSLLRPLKKYSEETGQGDWQFTVTNPGGTMISIRDARHPSWHLIVPLGAENEWRFVDLDQDPYENNPIISLDMDTLQSELNRKHGEGTASWIEEATAVCRWWVEENKRRWRYDEHSNQAAPTRRRSGLESSVLT